MKIVGIDPGKSGGISYCDETGKVVETVTMPTYEVDGKDKIDFKAVAAILKKHNPDKVYIENVHAMPGQGVTSMFNFGFSTGGLHGVCGALNITVEIVNPRTWQKKLMGDAKHEKEDTINFCLKNWPELNLFATKRSKKHHDGMADACAIAHYGFINEKDKSIAINKE